MTILHICASFQRVRSHSGRKDRDREGGRERERERDRERQRHVTF